MPITLADIRSFNTDYTDEETGIRYTTDTLGNQIIITPDKPPSELGEGEELTYGKALPEPESKTFKDPSGKEVTLTETDIRPYLFDPTLIEREADIARVSTPYGISTLDRGEFEGRELGEAIYQDPFTSGEPTRLMPGAEKPERRVSEEEQQKIQEASQRIQGRAGITPPGARPAGGAPTIDYTDPESRNDFENFIFEKMGGDPRGLNAHTEVMNMVDIDTAQQIYIQRWEEGMPIWNDLSQSDKEKVSAMARSQILPEVEAEIAGKVQAHKIAMDKFDRTKTAYHRQFKLQTEQKRRDLATVAKERQATDVARRSAAASLKRWADNLQTIGRLRESGEPNAEEQIRKLESANTQLEASITAAKEHLGISPKKKGDKVEPEGKLKPTAGVKAKPQIERPEGAKPDWVEAEEKRLGVKAAPGKWKVVGVAGKDSRGRDVPPGKYFLDEDGELHTVGE